jgi:hypothetical protein
MCRRYRSKGRCAIEPTPNFQAFYDFLLSLRRQAELAELLAKVQQLAAIDNRDRPVASPAGRRRSWRTRSWPPRWRTSSNWTGTRNAPGLFEGNRAVLAALLDAQLDPGRID